MKFIIHALVNSLLCLLVVPTSNSQDHAAAVKDYLTKDVVAVVYFDLDKVDPNAFLETAGQLGFVEEPDLPEIPKVAAQASRLLASLTDAGIHQVYGMIRTSDLAEQGTSWIIPIDESKNPQLAKKAIEGVIAEYRGGNNAFRKFDVAENRILIGSTDNQLRKLKMDRPTQPRDLDAAWESLGSGSVGLIVFGNPDSRRVVRELMPTPPAPFDSITPKLIADDLKWAGIYLILPPHLSVNLEIETANSTAAQAVATALHSGLKIIESNGKFHQLFTNDDRTAIMAALQPTIGGNRLSVSLDSIVKDPSRLASIMAPAVRATQLSAADTQEANNLKRIASALHNYESTLFRLPSPNGKSDRHPAGLSWRVHILPYFGEQTFQALYEQFKLDEPWDSEHNLPLSKKMPAVFQSPMPECRQTNLSGRTTYQLPIHAEAIFKPGDVAPAGFGEMHDGSSNTIWLVAVAADNAVVWTKPEDWNVDLENPLKGLLDGKRETFTAAGADGAVHQFPVTVDPKTLRHFIQCSDGNMVQWPN